MLQGEFLGEEGPGNSPLPICCGRIMPDYEQQDASPLPTNDLGKRILVIDDGDSVRDIIRIFLEHAGFEVCGEAADGVEAIEQAKKLKPDLIVLDLAMPRMNGAEAASVLSKTMPHVPIVLLTLYQNMLDLHWHRRSASRPFWTKQTAWTSWSRAFVHCYNPLILKGIGATFSTCAKAFTVSRNHQQKVSVIATMPVPSTPGTPRNHLRQS